jgi:hypothetical protein
MVAPGHLGYARTLVAVHLTLGCTVPWDLTLQDVTTVLIVDPGIPETQPEV